MHSTIKRFLPRDSAPAVLAVVLMSVGGSAAWAQPSARPPAGEPSPSASTSSATSGARASRPPMKGQASDPRPGGGSGYNPGGSGGSGSNAGGGSGYNPGGSGRPNYGQGGGSNAGGGSGYNPGGDWNGHTGDGWNPGNYYSSSIIKGWVRLGSATAGKSPDRDTIQAFGRYRYASIKLCVRFADVAFYNAKVQFEHGGSQDVKVQSRVKRGQCTREYFLRGGKKLDIRYVYLFFRQSDNIANWRTAQVDLYAR